MWDPVNLRMAIGAFLAIIMTTAASPTYVKSLSGAEAMYEIPNAPRGILFLAHGCQHSATDFWAPTAECPQCLGLPEEVRIVKAALREGFAVIAISSQDREVSRCWSFESDGPIVKRALDAFRERHHLPSLPLAALGASSGGAFVLQLAGIMRLVAVISQIMAIPPAMLSEPMPPTLFIHMSRDQRTAAFVHKDVKRIKNMSSGQAEQIEVAPQKPSAAFFTDRIERLDSAAASALHAALRRHGLLNADGFLAEDPRRSAWREAIRASDGLGARLPGPGPNSPADTLVGDESAVSEVLNVAWAMHEIVSDEMDETLQFIARATLRQRAELLAAASMVEGSGPSPSAELRK